MLGNSRRAIEMIAVFVTLLAKPDPFCRATLQSRNFAGGMFSKPEPICVIEAGADAGSGITELYGDFEHRGLPLSEFGMTIGK